MNSRQVFLQEWLNLGALREQQLVAVDRGLAAKILRWAEGHWGRQFVHGHLYADKTGESSLFLDIQNYFGSIKSDCSWTLNPLVGYVSFQLLNTLFEWIKMEKEKRSHSCDDNLESWWSVLWPGGSSTLGHQRFRCCWWKWTWKCIIAFVINNTRENSWSAKLHILLACCSITLNIPKILLVKQHCLSKHRRGSVGFNSIWGEERSLWDIYIIGYMAL